MNAKHLARSSICPLLLLAAVTLQAQTSAAVDAAGSRVEFAGGGASSVFSLTPSLRWDGQQASVSAYGSWASFGSGAWSAQGALGGSVYGPALLGLRPEVGALLGGTVQEGGHGTGQWAGAARLHYAGARLGAWLGGSLGRADDGTNSRAVAVGEAGVWARLGAATLIGTALPTRIGDSLRHTDLIGAVRVERGPLDATVSGGWRTWSRPGNAPDATWAGINAAWWLTPHVAIVAGAGTYPTDWAQGLPSGRFAVLGLRLATRRPTPRRDIGARLLPPGVVPVVPAFEASDQGNGQWVLRLRAPAAKRVEIMGDFTQWEPVALEPGTDGRWFASFRLAPGVHHLNIRVDGGVWGVPPGLPVLRDEFSGVAAVLIVAPATPGR